jgi:hypothetical protein
LFFLPADICYEKERVGIKKREMADQCPYLKASLNSEKRPGNGANKTVAEGRLVQLLEGIKHKCL